MTKNHSLTWSSQGEGSLRSLAIIKLSWIIYLSKLVFSWNYIEISVTNAASIEYLRNTFYIVNCKILRDRDDIRSYEVVNQNVHEYNSLQMLIIVIDCGFYRNFPAVRSELDELLLSMKYSNGKSSKLMYC